MVRTQKKSFTSNLKYIRKTRKKNKKQLGGADASTKPKYEDIIKLDPKPDYPLQGVYPNGITYEILEPYGEEINFYKNTKINLERFNEIPERDILFLNIHGKVSENKYFRVPANVMVCIVNDVGDFSSLFQSNLIFLDKGKSSEEKKQLIDELFRYQAQMSDDNTFEFKTATETDGIFNFTCSNFFRNSNWYYPGQICYDVELSAHKTKYKKEGLCICDIYEVPTLERPNDIRINSKTLSLKKYFQQEDRHDLFINKLSAFCQKETSKKRIIILNSCQGIQNINEEQKLKKHNWYHHENNKKITEEIMRPVERTSNYKYSCYINRYNYGTNIVTFESDIKYLTSKPFQVNPYDKKYKIFELVKKYFEAHDDLEKTHLLFLKSLNLNELQIFFEKIDTSKHDEILKKVIDTEYVDKEANILFKIMYLNVLVNTSTSNYVFKGFLKKIMNYYNKFRSYIDPDIKSSKLFKNISILLNLKPEEQYFNISSIYDMASTVNNPPIIIMENSKINCQKIDSDISKYAHKNEIKLFIFKTCNVPEDFTLNCTKNKKIQFTKCNIDHNFNSSKFMSLYIESCMFKMNKLSINSPNHEFLTKLELLNVTGLTEISISNTKLERIIIKDCSFSSIQILNGLNLEYLEIYNTSQVLKNLELKFPYLKSLKLSNYDIKENDINIPEIYHIELETLNFDIGKILDSKPLYFKCQGCTEINDFTCTREIQDLLLDLNEQNLYLEMIPSNPIQDYYEELNYIDEDDFGGARR